MALSEEARAELRDAMRIIREDRFEAYARQTLGRSYVRSEEEEGAPGDPPADTGSATPPPPRSTPPKDSGKSDTPANGKDDKPGRKSSYWGEIFDED